MDNNAANSDSDTQEEEHTLIHVVCKECEKISGLTILEHAEDSQQVRAVNNAHETMAENHTDDTGHQVEINLITGSPKEIITTAKEMAESVPDVEPEDFNQDTINFV